MKPWVPSERGESFRCREVWRVFTNKVRCAAFSPNGTRVLAGFEDHTVQEIGLAVGMPVRKLAEHRKTATAIAFLPDGEKFLSGGEDWVVRLWEARDGAAYQGKTVGGHGGPVYGVACAPDGKRFLSCGMDENIVEWSLPDGERLHTLEGHGASVFSVAYSPDGLWAVSAGADHNIKIWSLADERCLETLKGHTQPVHSVAWSPDGLRILSGGWDHAVKLWDVAWGICLKTLKGHARPVYGVAISSDGKCGLSGGGDPAVKLWDLETGKCLLTLDGHSHQVRVVAFSPDMHHVLSGGNDGLRLWEISRRIRSEKSRYKGKEQGDALEWPKADQRVLAAALWQCWISKSFREPYVIKKLTLPGHFQSGKESGVPDAGLTRAADLADKPLGDALRDLAGKNKHPTPVVVSRKRLPRVQVVSDADLERVRHRGPGGRWANFCTSYPDPIGEIEISRPGISTDGSCAVLFLGRQGAWGFEWGRLWVFRRQKGRWRLTAEEVGPRWIS